MTSIRKSNRDYVYADLNAVASLLKQIGENDILARIGLESRLKELQEAVSEMESAEPETLASAELYFGGKPVVGNYGIESEFGGEAIFKFQDLISKVMAQESGGLGQRGVVRNKPASALHITNIVRGSFGFLLEEIPEQPQLAVMETPLKVAVDKTTRLLDAFGEFDESNFRSAVETIDDRILVTARDFFSLMRQNEATLRLVTSVIERTFGPVEITRAVERANTTAVDEVEERIPGKLTGLLPDGHQFEFQIVSGPDTKTIRGKVDRTIPTDQLRVYIRDLVDVDTVANMRIKRVRRNDTVVLESYTLLSLGRPSQAQS